jgi:cytidylate kinase
MSIITISRGSFSTGKEVAERVAERLNYECISRAILLEASDQFNIPEIKLTKALSDPPSILENFTHGKQNYIAHIQSALTSHVVKDNVVYHGLAGHLFLKNVSHVLKVRIIADMEARIAAFAAREGVSGQEAHSRIVKIDDGRRKWTKKLYGVDPWDSSLYDLVIKIHSFKVDNAADIICRAISTECFASTKESQMAMADLALACQVKVALVAKYPNVFVMSDYGNILIYSKSSDHKVHEMETMVMALAAQNKEIHNVEVHNGVVPPKNAV